MVQHPSSLMNETPHHHNWRQQYQRRMDIVKTRSENFLDLKAKTISIQGVQRRLALQYLTTVSKRTWGVWSQLIECIQDGLGLWDLLGICRRSIDAHAENLIWFFLEHHTFQLYFTLLFSLYFLNIFLTLRNMRLLECFYDKVINTI